jgi:hypothetical protein
MTGSFLLYVQAGEGILAIERHGSVLCHCRNRWKIGLQLGTIGDSPGHHGLDTTRSRSKTPDVVCALIPTTSWRIISNTVCHFDSCRPYMTLRRLLLPPKCLEEEKLPPVASTLV